MSLSTYYLRAPGDKQPFVNLNPSNIISNRSPLTSDQAQKGTLWVNTLTNQTYILTSFSAGSAIWSEIANNQAPNQVVVATAAHPTAQVTINARQGLAIFTGFTTADGGTIQDYTIINNLVTTSSAVLLTVSNLNASANNAAITLTGLTLSAGDLFVVTENNGGGSLGAGDNVLISFWVLN